MSRSKVAAGNWKMHTTVTEGTRLADAIVRGWEGTKALVVLAPPFTHLTQVVQACAGTHVMVAAQNCHHEPEGACTGEISAPTLKEIGVRYVILGHSERRQYFGETNHDVLLKLRAVIRAGMQPILCCGEPLEVREAGTHESYVRTQLEQSAFLLAQSDFSRIVIAYEPIWAIGTGKTATSEQVQNMHAFIRELIDQQFDMVTAGATSILYGGSVKPNNAQELFAQKDVDGGLIGGASLNADSFLEIASTLNSI